MVRGIHVKRLTDPLSADDGVLFYIEGTGPPLPRRARVLDALTPSKRVASLRRDTAARLLEFRVQYWRELGTRSNVEELAKLRYLGKRSRGVTLLTREPVAELSASAAVAELLDGANQRPPDWGHYGYVYVVELTPRPGKSKPEIYVGDTRKSPEERFRDHVTDHRRRRSGVRTSSACVRKRGIRLAYELFKETNPLPRGTDSCEAAKELRRQLEPHFEVCGSPECMESRSVGRRDTPPTT